MTHNPFTTLEQGATLLTANRRLARHLRQAFDAHQRRQGRAVWATADILPLSAWLERCWNEILDTAAAPAEFPALLTSHQELALWEHIIADSPEGQELLRIPAAAQEAQEAWMLLRQWRIALDDMQPPLNDDAHAFRRWARHFAKRCSASAWMDRGSLMDFVAQQIGTGALKAPRHVLLAGFDELTPQQQALIAALRAADVIVDELPPSTLTGAAMRIGLADAEAEIRVAARWARDLLEQGEGSIGVVIHDLGVVREKVARIFNDTLLPDAALPGGDDDIPLYNISLGQPLQDQPVVHAALLILDIQGRLPLEKAGSLLRSPFLAGAEQEMTRRGRLDARLRRVGELTVSVEALRRLALGGGENGVCSQLAAALERWLETARSLPRSQTPSAWAAAFSRLLAAIGWPGERSLDSREYQAVVAWRELLADYARLDVVIAGQGMGDALARLRQMAGSVLFQPQGADAPVQILGVLEAAGMQFDHLWVMGLHDEVWPASPRPNPFLPHELQRKHGLPHASAERELLFARRVTDRLLAAAKHVIVSYPRQDGDRERRPSPLIAALSEATPDQLSLAQHDSWMNVIHATQTIEERDDHQAPSLAAGTSVSGGTGVLKQQAACPFRAFAEHRLGAKPLPVADVGLSPGERGQLLHAALERVWRRLRCHEELCRASPEEMREIIAEAVVAAIDGMAQKRRGTFTAKFKALEEDRLVRLITDWLELEKQRAAFTVLELEQQHAIQVGGLTLSTRIDRIDQLPDGRQVIVDYKTSDANIGGWFGDRPDEPQLPLYCMHNGKSIAGLAFAQLRPGSSAFKGLTQNAGIMPDVKALAETRYGKVFTWEELAGTWQKTLQRLADEFRAGRAEVDPKKPSQTCQFCALPTLCRINEHDGLGVTETEEGEDNE